MRSVGAALSFMAIAGAAAAATTCETGDAKGLPAPAVPTLMVSGTNTSEAWMLRPDCSVKRVPVLIEGEGDDANSVMRCTNMPIERIQSLPPVQRIFLDGTRITKADLSNNTDIIHIILASCGLESVSGFRFPDSLDELDFEDNDIKEIPAGVIPDSVTILYLGENNIDSLDSISLPGSLDSLYFKADLFPTINFAIPYGLSVLNMDENQLLTKIENLTMPSSLTTFSCVNCNVDTIRGVQFSKKFVAMDLTNSTVTTFEIRESDALILKNLPEFSGNITPSKCNEPNVSVTQLREDLSACVITDARFEELYPTRLQSTKPSDSSSVDDVPVPTVTPEPPTTSSSSSTTLIAVIAVIGGLLLIAAIAVVYRVFFSKKAGSTASSSGGKYQDAESTQPIQGSSNQSLSHRQSQEYLSNDVRIDEALIRYRIDFQDLFVLNVIAKGGFGVVHLATVKNKEVAVKQLLPEKAQDMATLKGFMDEIRLCAKMEHPHIVAFVGVSWSSLMDVALVLEYMAGGDLTAALASQRKAPEPEDWIEASSALRAKCLYAMDVASALVYLHSFQTPIIHRDLKSKNVLLTADGEAKLSDFGVSRRLTLDETMTGEVGTVAWIAPEVLHGERYTEKADIYSFGVLLVELDTCQHPFKHELSGEHSTPKTNARLALLISTGKIVPQMSASCPPAVRALAAKCMSYEPDERPAAVEIHYEIRKIQLQNLRSSTYDY